MKNYDSLIGDDCNKPLPQCGCETVKGNAIEVQIQKDDCEVRADVVVGKSRGIRLWGQIRDCDGYPIDNALVKLVKVTHYYGKVGVQGIAHTMTDCTGFYQFEIKACEDGVSYRVLVHKASEGKERVVSETAMICNPCSDNPVCPL
ncbi:MAG: hypothetical protein ACRC68_10780 [Clostridium sp.]